MNDIHVVFIFIAVTMFVVFALILFAVFVLVRPWLRAALNAAPVSLFPIVAMRLLGNPPTLLIDAYIALKHAGMSVTIGDVDVYVENRNRVSTSDDLVELVTQRKDVD